MRAAAISVSAFLLLLVSGCGGGDGPVNPVAAFAPTGPGDSWLYSVDIEFVGFGKYSGTITEALTSDTYLGNPSVRVTSTFNLQLNTGPAVITSYEEVSPTGQLLAESVNGLPVAVTADTFDVPATLTRTTAVTGEITLANGDTFMEDYRVVGTQRVLTAAGTFDCWVVKQNVTHSDTTTDTYTIWVAPQTGNYVRLTDTTVNPDGSSYTYVASLTSRVSNPSAATVRSKPSFIRHPALQGRKIG